MKRYFTKEEQRRRVLKAKIALALYGEDGKVPSTEKVEHTYRVARDLYKAVLGTPPYVRASAGASSWRCSKAA